MIMIIISIIIAVLLYDISHVVKTPWSVKTFALDGHPLRRSHRQWGYWGNQFYCLSVSSLIKNKTQQREVIRTPNSGHIKYLRDQIQPHHHRPITPQYIHLKISPDLTCFKLIYVRKNIPQGKPADRSIPIPLWVGTEKSVWNFTPGSIRESFSRL